MDKEKKLIIEPSPHIRSANSTQQIMLNVIIATIPAMIASVVIFGARAALLITVCVCSCVFFEFFTRLLFRKTRTIGDLSAVVTGIILAFNLPANLPLYMAIIGAFAAIVVTKEMFGGLGQNFANPAVVGRIVLMLSFPAHMSSYPLPVFQQTVDAVTAPTPLSAPPDAAPLPIMELFLGMHGGSLGEVCSFALLLGFVYLLAMRIIRFMTPVVFITTVFVGTAVTGGDPIRAIFSGGLLLGAIFMATDYSTNPMTLPGKAIFAFGCGVVTLVIRELGSMPEGVAFSILLMNTLTPAIDKLTMPKPFWSKKPDKKTDMKPENIKQGK